MTKGQYPTISTGLGNLTPQLWRRIMVMLDEYEKKNRKNPSGAFIKSTNANMFLANITGATAISGGAANRFYYDWTELNITSASTVDTKAGGRTGTTGAGTAALNLCEIPNTANNIAPAIDLDGATFPAGYAMRAIGNCIDDTILNVPVVMHRIKDTSGIPRFVFSLANSIDGTSCT